MANQTAFSSPLLPKHRPQHQRRHRPICQTSPDDRVQNPSQPDQTRRRLLFLPLLPFLPMLTSQRPASAATLSQKVTPVLMCRKIMTPVSRYIEEGAWDKGRTNVNYCTRVLALRRNIRDSADFLEGDNFYDAMDIMGELDNTMTQLDASLYTPLFIPADDGISPEQKKYQTQARAFYTQAIDLLDGYIRLIPESELKEARTNAANTRYEIKFEDE